MPDTGVNAAFSFGGQVYDQDDCLSGWSLNDQIQEVVYQCGGMERGAPGVRQATFNISLAIAKDDTDKWTNLVPGATGVWEGHPAGDTPGYVEATSTDALIRVANKTTDSNAMIMIDLQIRLNDITLGTATTS